MSTQEGAIAPTPDVSNSAAIGGSTPADSSSAPAATDSSSSADVQPQSVQDASTETDPLANIPSLDELKAQAEQKVPYAEALANLRSVYETLKPQYSELSERFKIFEPISDRVESPEQVQQLFDMQEKLYGFANDPQTGELVPTTAPFIETLPIERADDMTVELLNRPTMDPTTGRQVPRMDLVLESIAESPEKRAHALRILGGVEPSAVAPTWAPSQEELEVINPELQSIYRQLPYDEREQLRDLDPAYINKQLERIKFQEDMMQKTRMLEQQQQRAYEQQQQAAENQARSAGDQFVEQGFRTVFQGFAEALKEKTQFIKPLDQATAEASGMTPDQVATANQQIQQTNEGLGLFTAVITGALAHPDTSWMVQDFLKAVGVDEKTLNGFNQARQDYALHGRNYGYLSHKANGNPAPDVANLKGNAENAARRLKQYGNAVSGAVLNLLSRHFEMRANSFNETLNSAGSVRPPINGTAYNEATAPVPARKPLGLWNKSQQDFDRQFG